MKILHTSDLHLGKSWDRRSRQADEDRILEEILDLCEQHDVDMLLVTGDVFSHRVEGSLAKVARSFLERLRSHLRRGRAVFLLRGNHDPIHLFELMRVLVNEMGGRDRWPLVVADLPNVYTVPGHRLQVVALPYLWPSMLERSVTPPGVGPDRRVITLAGLLAHLVEGLYGRASAETPAIFAGHILIRGTEIKPDLVIEDAYNQELWLEPSHLPQFTSYNALGHIHRSQKVSGVGKPTWYAGAPDRTDLGERDYKPQVLLVTTPDYPGGIATVQPLALTRCTPFIYATLTGREEVEHFTATLPTPDPLGKVIIGEVPVEARGVVEAQIRRIAPRVLIKSTLEAGTAITHTAGESGPDPQDVRATVKAYLARAYAGQEGKHRRLEAAFEALWSESREVITHDH